MVLVFRPFLCSIDFDEFSRPFLCSIDFDEFWLHRVNLSNNAPVSSPVSLIELATVFVRLLSSPCSNSLHKKTLHLLVLGECCVYHSTGGFRVEAHRSYMMFYQVSWQHMIVVFCF
jgi:hypothetical protein